MNRTRRTPAWLFVAPALAVFFVFALLPILQALRLNLEILQRDAGQSGVATDVVARSIEVVDRASDLTRRLLAFSRKQTLRPRVIDMNELVLGTAELLRRTLGEAIEVVVLSGTDLCACEIDPVQLENALLNVALNARDAMPGGGILTIETANVERPKVDVSPHTAAERGDYVEVRVSDDGKGMEPEALHHAFEPFYTTKEIGRGTGLGLSMVYGFIKQSGGEARIESEPGRGTTVTMWIPRSTAAVEDRVPTPADAAEPRGTGERVLLVEDDERLRKLLRELLVELGYVPIVAADGPSAIRSLKESSFSMLMTDIVLPGGMNGVELAANACRECPGLAVVYTSGYARGALPQGLGQLGGRELLEKPFTRRRLALALRAALDSNQP